MRTWSFNLLFFLYTHLTIRILIFYSYFMVLLVGVFGRVTIIILTNMANRTLKDAKSINVVLESTHENEHEKQTAKMS